MIAVCSVCSFWIDAGLATAIDHPHFRKCDGCGAVGFPFRELDPAAIDVDNLSPSLVEVCQLEGWFDV